MDVYGTVLVVEDDENAAEVVRISLEDACFQVQWERDGKAGLEAALRLRPDVLVLDVGLPKMDGLTVCRELRKQSELPILMLSAKSQDLDKILGLEIGADDYLAKPFNPRELVARVRALHRRLRRIPEDGMTVLRVGQLEISAEAHELRVNGEVVHLTSTEFSLLQVMAARPGRALTREQLIELVWGSNFSGDERTVDVHLRRLRSKIEEHHDHDYFQVVRGVGYKFVAPAMTQA